MKPLGILGLRLLIAAGCGCGTALGATLRSTGDSRLVVGGNERSELAKQPQPWGPSQNAAPMAAMPMAPAAAPPPGLDPMMATTTVAPPPPVVTSAEPVFEKVTAKPFMPGEPRPPPLPVDVPEPPPPPPLPPARPPLPPAPPIEGSVVDVPPPLPVFDLGAAAKQVTDYKTEVAETQYLDKVKHESKEAGLAAAHAATIEGGTLAVVVHAAVEAAANLATASGIPKDEIDKITLGIAKEVAGNTTDVTPCGEPKPTGPEVPSNPVPQDIEPPAPITTTLPALTGDDGVVVVPHIEGTGCKAECSGACKLGKTSSGSPPCPHAAATAVGGLQDVVSPGAMQPSVPGSIPQPPPEVRPDLVEAPFDMQPPPSSLPQPEDIGAPMEAVTPAPGGLTPPVAGAAVPPLEPAAAPAAPVALRAVPREPTQMDLEKAAAIPMPPPPPMWGEAGPTSSFLARPKL